MPKRDIKRERILAMLSIGGALFLENIKIDYESDGHITLTYSPELPIPTIYDIKISKRR